MTQESNAARLMRLLAAQLQPDVKIDGQAVADTFGLSSVQQLAFMKSVNEEFGLDITLDDIEAAEGKGGLVSLIPEQAPGATQESNAARLMRLLAAQLQPDVKIDGQAVADTFGLSSVQQLAFMNSVNEEFGLNITLDDIEAAEGKGGLVALIPEA